MEGAYFKIIMNEQLEPLVSCITPTFGRFHLLKEMYWCWTNQTYENKELIIVNDQPNLTISCDDKRVKIFNYDKRFPCLGSKRNICIEKTSNDTKYILPFDDDDLFMPDHIKTLVDGFSETSFCHRTKNYRHMIIKNNSFDNVMEGNQPFFGASCFDAKIMKEIKFPENLIQGEDVRWMDSNKIKTHIISHAVPTFAYRLGMGIVHASGHKVNPNDPEAQKIIFEKIGNSVDVKSNTKHVKLVPELSGAVKLLYNSLLEKTKKGFS